MKRNFIHFSTLINAIIIFMFIPFLSNFLIGKIGVFATSILIPMYGIVNFLTSVFIGNLSDILGKYQTFIKVQKYQILFWIILVILVYFKLYLAFAALYGFSAVFNVILNGTTSSYLYSMAKSEEKIKKFNTINYIMFNIGVFLGPVIGGIIFEKYNFWVLITYLIFICLQFIVFIILFKKENFKTKEFKIKENFNLTRKLVSNKFNFIYYILLVLIGIIWVGVYDSVMPTFFIQKHQSLKILKYTINSHQLVSFTLLINGLLLVIITWFINYLVRRVDVWIKYLIIGFILVIANLLFFIPSPIGVITSIIIISFAEVIMPQAQTQILYVISDENNRAQYITFFQSATMIALSFANIFIYLITTANIIVVAMILLAIGVITILLTLYLILVWKKLKKTN